MALYSSTTLTVTLSVLTTAFLSFCLHKITMTHHASQWEQKRAAERKGRIRTEIKLRTALKQQPQTKMANTFTLRQIGIVISPYTKRMGTPRQGSLTPSSRAYVEFSQHIQPTALEGLEQYSHVWIIFEFHANTNLGGESRKSKIKPPRAPKKVGMLSTRSPHRPNPLGLSLVKLEKLQGRKLYISALDLVNGTPVYDVKPCVPWDIPTTALIVPEWVSQNDVASVEFTHNASSALKKVMESDISPAYEKNQVELVKNAISEILAQDPRAGNKRGTSSDKPYNIVFGSARIEFVVSSNGVVQVVGIKKIEFPQESYVDGIPLLSEVTMK